MPREKLRSRSKIMGADAIERLSYIDSVWLICMRKIPSDKFRELIRTLEAPSYSTKTRVVPQNLEYTDQATGEIHFIQKLAIHQPTIETIRQLADLQVADPTLLKLTELHIALDLTTSSHEEASRLDAEIRSVYRPFRRPVSPGTYFPGTAYFGKVSRVGCRVLLYSDRKSKVSPCSPCTHIEYRIRGASQLRKEGLLMASDLLAINHQTFWSKKLCFIQRPSLQRLEKIIEHRAKRAGVQNAVAAATAHIRRLTRISMDDMGNFVVADFDYELRADLRINPTPLYKKISNLWALPEPSNALWG